MLEDRIRKLIELKKLNAAQFADKIGVQRSSISHILSGRNRPSLEFLQKILKNYPEINADWLLTGNGNISDEKNTLFENTPDVHLYEEKPIGKIRPQNINNVVSNISDKNEIVEDFSIERVIIFYKNGKLKEYIPKD